jgi:hypothetical protein
MVALEWAAASDAAGHRIACSRFDPAPGRGDGRGADPLAASLMEMAQVPTLEIDTDVDLAAPFADRPAGRVPASLRLRRLRGTRRRPPRPRCSCMWSAASRRWH